MDTRTAKLLIASESVTDAELVQRLLQSEFEHITLSTKSECAAKDFDGARPDVVFLAFEKIEKAERYYLSLYRQSPMLASHPHRTVVLCSKDELRQAYDLCKQGCFDDYILFWPMTHDTYRLPMAAMQAVRELEYTEQLRTNGALAAHGRRIVGLEATLDDALLQYAEQLSDAKDVAQQEVSEAIDGMARCVMTADLEGAVEIRDAAKLRQRLADFRETELEERHAAIDRALRPIEQWASDARQSLAVHMEAARSLSAAARSVPPSIFLVEDDELQRKIISRLLAEGECKVECYATGFEALRAIRDRRPDMVLLDFGLPDLKGLEVLKQMRANEALADVPIAMITGHSHKDLVVECRKAGAADFLVKPVQKDTLIGKVRSLLEGAKALQAPGRSA